MTSNTWERSWDEFPNEPPRLGSEVSLERNGWQALLAYLAGPAWTYQVPAPSEPVVVYSGGSSYSRPASTEEDDIRSEELRLFLAENSVPYPPDGVEWRLVLPAGTDAESFWRDLNGTVARLDPAQQRVREVVEEQLQALLVRE